MSLINQMLRDLDARRAIHGGGVRLPEDIRPLPEARRALWPFALALVLLAAIAVGAAAYLLSDARRPAVTAAAPTAAPVPSAASTPPAVPVTPVPATPPAAAEAPASTPMPPPAVRPSPFDGGLRLADVIEAPPAEKTAPPAPPAAPTPAAAPPLKPAAAARNEARPLPAAPAPASPPAAQSAIAKALAAPPPAVNAAQPAIERSEVAAPVRAQGEAEYRKAIAAINQGRLNEGEEALHQALRQDSRHASARQLLVKLLLEARRPDEALPLLQEGLREQPGQLAWAMTLARLHVDRGALEESWRTLEASLPAAAGQADYQGFAGYVLHRLGRDKESAERYLAAARLSPADGRWWLGLGLAYDAEGRSTEAREAFLRARQSGTLSPELAAIAEQKLR